MIRRYRRDPKKGVNDSDSLLDIARVPHGFTQGLKEPWEDDHLLVARRHIALAMYHLLAARSEVESSDSMETASTLMMAEVGLNQATAYAELAIERGWEES